MRLGLQSQRFAIISLVPLSLVFFILTSSLIAQDSAAGIQPFSLQVGGQYDSIDPASGNILLMIPVVSKTGKIPFTYKLFGNFHAYLNNCGSGCAVWGVNVGGGSRGPGLIGAPTTPNLGTYIASTTSPVVCGSNSGTLYSNVSVVDATGAQHPTLLQVQVGNCGTSMTGSGETFDGSGYQIIGSIASPPATSIYDHSGDLAPGGGVSVTDPDGVQITSTPNGTYGIKYTDTLKQTVLTTSPGSLIYHNGVSDTYTYSDVSGNPTLTVRVNYTKFTQRTNFGCSGIQEVGPGAQYFPTSVVLADGETFGISYEGTPGYSGDITGRLAGISFPQGGSVTFTYTGGNNNTGITCGGVIPTLTRTVKDANGHTSVWKYVNSGTGNFWSPFTVTETDPAGDTITHQFYGELETERIVKDVNLGTLSTTVTCYNGNNSSKSSCITPGPGTQTIVYQTDVYTYLGSSSTPSLVETKYDVESQTAGSLGMVTAIKKWLTATYPPSGTPTSETDITYANIGGSCGSMSSYIVDRPCSVTGYSAGTKIRGINYTYNSGGHPTQTTTWVNASSSLSSSATYNSNGTIATFTDVNNSVTKYYYNGTNGCNGMLLTSTVLPVNTLTSSQQWNCFGGVLTKTLDFNQQPTSYGYVDQGGVPDPLWRLRSTTDALGNVTWVNYSAAGTVPATVESSMSFNNSILDQITTMDGLGRPILQQTRQGPGSSNFDTVSIGYDLNGRTASKGMLCTSTESVACSSALTTTTYDAMNRALQVTDGGGGYTSYTYTAGSTALDVLQTTGPAPGGESLKKRQLEYDGLGRLTSVCELTAGTSGWPGGTCSQSTQQTGYWTKYTYDGAGKLLTVLQNAQAPSGSQQNRSFQYDGLGRLTLEQNPESGQKIYAYDVRPSACYQYSNSIAGSLTGVTDNAGNLTCYEYDALKRVLDIAAGTYCKRFSYDQSTGAWGQAGPSGYPAANLAGRLVEAETDSCSGWPPTVTITDEWFSYGPRGPVNDFFESTPHSGGYYHSSQTVNANFIPGAVNLYNSSGAALIPTQTNGLDGEGRINAVSASSGQNPVSSVTYSPLGEVTKVTFGSTDSDSFSYDPNTGRMTQYAFTVGSTPQTLTGSLLWNVNGTLNTLAIIDPFNSADTQTCNYGYDDLSRVSSVGCGAENSLPNSGFESGNTGWGLSAAFSIVNNPSNAQSGDWYLSGSSTSQGGANANNHLWVPITPNSVLHYGGWINRVAGTGTMWWDCEVVDSNYNFVTWCNPAGLGDGSAGAGWNFYENSITVPSNAAYVTFYAEIHGGGDTDTTLTTGYFDNAMFSSSAGIWQQSFSYDTFGNISKSGTAAWLPNYNNTKNQYVQGWNGASYDNNGNLLNDTFNTYTWDAYGNMASANAATATYDAFGRMVELLNGPDRPQAQFVYSPAGGPVLAETTGQSLVQAFVQLPGGGYALYYSSSNLNSYAHPDWLGSTRLASKTDQTPLPTMAYAPFGEGYAGGMPDYVTFTTGGYAFTVNSGGNAGGTLEDFMFRRYNPSQSRWISPDPAGSSAVNPSNPQSWNRYAYVLNNPLIGVDPSGLECVWDDGSNDSATDPQTGSYDSCTSAGGVWVDPEYFATLGLGDWSSTSNTFLQGIYDAADWAENPDLTVWGYPDSTSAANNGTWNWIKNAARKIGNYIPVSCGAGAFAYAGANVGSPASLAVAKWYQWDSIDGSSKGLFTELSGGEGVTGGVGAQATPGQNTEYYAFVGPGVKNVGPFSGNVSGFVSTDFSSYGSQGFAAEGAFGRATGGVGVYMNFMSLTACMDKAH